jgi:hypothetical protein
MNTKRAEILDFYSEYLIASFGQTTATGLSKLVSHLSHDQITRFLLGEPFTDKDLWRIVKPHVRRVQSEDAVLIIDDTVEEKPYTDESELVSWHYDHSRGRTVKGVNLVSALYFSGGVSLPVALHLVQKTELVTDAKTGAERFESPVSKNEVLRSMVASCASKEIPFRYVLADGWFSSRENMEFIKKKARRDFVIPLKGNRNVYLTAPWEKTGKPTKLESLEWGTDETRTVYLENLDFGVLVCRRVFQNENGTVGVLYLCASDLSLSGSDLSALYQKRWKVEEYHKSLKSCASFSKSPTRRVRSQGNHFFASVVAFVKMEICRVESGLNHFAQKARLYRNATRAAFEELQILRRATAAPPITS